MEMKSLVVFAVAVCVLIGIGCPGSPNSPDSVSFNVVGSWRVTASFPTGGTKTWTVTYTDSEKTGDVALKGGGWSASGTYSVDGNKINFDVSSAEGEITFSGTFSNENEMNGNGTMLLSATDAYQGGTFNFEWKGIRE